jgi:hypothetical protein
MAEITNLTQMRNYVLRKLGFPVNNVEISTEQLDDAIWDTVQDFRRYNYEDGTFLDYVIFNTNAGQSEYATSAISGTDGVPIATGTEEGIEAIYNFEVSFGMDGINTLFSPTHMLLYNQYVNQGGYPGGPGSTGGFVLADYQIAMMYLDMISEMFGKHYRAKYIPGKRVVQVIPTPDQPLTAVLQIYRHGYASHLYNNPLVKKLAVARAKVRWGGNLNKYGGSMPDGLTINADAILSEGLAEEEKWFERMSEESAPPDFYIA